MKITVLMGSPNRDGSTAMMASEFVRGAKEAGHDICVIDVAHAEVDPCSGCIACGYNGPCVQRDEMDSIRSSILDSDMMVFATPLYYYGMSAQLKTVIDRFCAFNTSLQGKRLKSAMLSVAWNSDGWTFDALESHYQTLVRYLNLSDQGAVYGRGCGTPSMTKRSPYLHDAYQLGRNLR